MITDYYLSLVLDHIVMKIVTKHNPTVFICAYKGEIGGESDDDEQNPNEQ